MIASKEWNWQTADHTPWLEPCEESYFFARKWLREGRKSLLDLGCGLGRHAMLFAQYGFSVTAADLSECAVGHLRDLQKREGLEFPAIVCDMLSLPFEDNSFDCFWAYHVMSHTDSEGIRKTISEVSRVLRPGGAAYFDLSAKDTWMFQSSGFPMADESTVIIRGGEEDGIPHFCADLNDIERLMTDFTLTRVRHIDDCIVDGVRGSSSHYYIEAVLRDE